MRESWESSCLCISPQGFRCYSGGGSAEGCQGSQIASGGKSVGSLGMPFTRAALAPGPGWFGNTLRADALLGSWGADGLSLCTLRVWVGKARVGF